MRFDPNVARRPGFAVRSNLKAGRSVCYQEVGGVWYPIPDPTYPYPPAPTPAPTPGVQWLNCQSCTGTKIGEGALQNAACEVCNL
jgi:hypothetical protein